MTGQKRAALKRPGVKASKQEKRYQIDITECQIALIRSFAFRTGQLYIRYTVNRVPDEDGNVVAIPSYECFFCNKASYESAAAIPHSKDCIVPLAEREYGALNEQFLAVEHAEEVSP